MLDDKALDLIFRQARSQNGWLPTPVSDDHLRAIYELMKWGPHLRQLIPVRILFLRTPEAKQKLVPALMASNVDKVLTAPVVAVIGHDMKFYDLLPRLFPTTRRRDWFAGEANRPTAEITAFRNGTLQGAYLIIAARALGLDCGPMSGFDNAKVDEALFAGTTIRTNFICGIGHGDPAKVYKRSPRLEFDEVCRLL